MSPFEAVARMADEWAERNDPESPFGQLAAVKGEAPEDETIAHHQVHLLIALPLACPGHLHEAIEAGHTRDDPAHEEGRAKEHLFGAGPPGGPDESFHLVLNLN